MQPSGLCVSGCSPDLAVSTAHSWGYLQISAAFQVCYSLPEQNNPHKAIPMAGCTAVSVMYKGRGRIFKGKVIKICDKVLRNPNIHSLKNNSNCVRNTLVQAYIMLQNVVLCVVILTIHRHVVLNVVHFDVLFALDSLL